jgi:putative two-component system response regulator
MPAMSGFELVPIIRSYPEHKHTPIIFVTADGTVSQISAALNLGACDFIVKPIKEDVLRKKIAQHLANDKELP